MRKDGRLYCLWSLDLFPPIRSADSTNTGILLDSAGARHKLARAITEQSRADAYAVTSVSAERHQRVAESSGCSGCETRFGID